LLALFDYGQAMAHAPDPDRICAEIRARFGTPLSVSACVLFEYRDTTQQLVAASAAGAHAAVLRRLVIPLGERISGWVAANRMPIVNSDAGLDLEALILAPDEPLRRCLAVPLVSSGTLVGVLTVYSKESPFNDQHAHVMTVVAERIAPTLSTMFASRSLDRDWAMSELTANVNPQKLEASAK
jgi:GAF domain-containing protein